MTNEKIKLFSDSDLDGISCGILANAVFSETDVEFCTPKDINQKLINFIDNGEYNNYSRVFITDLVIKEEVARKIDGVNDCKFRMFDHHKSSYQNNKFIWATIHESISGRKTCGTELFWNHIKEFYIKSTNVTEEWCKIVGTYVEYVRLWDTWDWTRSNIGVYAKNLNTLLHIYSRTKFINTILKAIVEGHTDFISDTENEIIALEENRKSRYIKQKMNNVRFHTYEDMRFGYVFAENYISELGNYMVKNIEDIKFAALINSDSRIVSFRALESAGVDLSKIASTISPQGGGHPLSAGCSFDISIEDAVIKSIFDK